MINIGDIALESLDWATRAEKQCWNCNGKGEVKGNLWRDSITTCDVCKGTGIEHKQIKIKILFKCDCGYIETENDEYTGYCPLCK